MCCMRAAGMRVGRGALGGERRGKVWARSWPGEVRAKTEVRRGLPISLAQLRWGVPSDVPTSACASECVVGPARVAMLACVLCAGRAWGRATGEMDADDRARPPGAVWLGQVCRTELPACIGPRRRSDTRELLERISSSSWMRRRPHTTASAPIRARIRR